MLSGVQCPGWPGWQCGVQQSSEALGSIVALVLFQGARDKEKVLTLGVAKFGLVSRISYPICTFMYPS